VAGLSHRVGRPIVCHFEFSHAGPRTGDILYRITPIDGHSTNFHLYFSMVYSIDSEPYNHHRMRLGLEVGTLVPPMIISDRSQSPLIIDRFPHTVSIIPDRPQPRRPFAGINEQQKK
jgi:hypothetical protein